MATDQQHEVTVDYDSHGRPWLRCGSHDGDQDGLGEGHCVFRQLYHTQAEFEQLFRRFLNEHPPTDGMITDLDHGRCRRNVARTLHYLNIH